MENAGVIIIMIVSVIISTIIVNGVYKLIMKISGADTMFFSVKKKLIAILVVAFIIGGLLMEMFGLTK